jgi:hypothetical protein
MFTPDVSALEEEGGAGGGGGGGGAGTGGPADDGEVRPKKQFVRSVPVSIAAGVWPHLGQTPFSAPPPPEHHERDAHSAACANAVSIEST